MLTQNTLTMAALALVGLASSAPLPAVPDLSTLLRRSIHSPNNKPGSYRMPLKPMRRNSPKIIQQKRATNNGSTNFDDKDLGDDGIQDDMVDGGADFLYAGVIAFGHPDPQELYIQLDTGSSLLAVYGEEFEENYPNKNDGTSRGAPFKLSETNATDLGIKARYRYADTTYFNASIYQDDLIIGGFKLEDQPFALMTAGNFSTPGTSVSGILGLGWSTMNAGITPSRTNTTPAVEQLWRSGALKEPLFSFSMIRNKVKDNITYHSENEGGVFTLGELDSSLYSGDVAWRPLVYETPYSTTKPSSWHSQIDSLTVNGKPLVGTENMTTLFDTGSAAISLPVDIVQAIYANTPDMLINESGDYVKCPLPFAGPSPLNITVNYGGQQFPILFEDLVAARVNTTDGVLACQIQISRSTHAVMGAGFLKNVFSAYRFDPPSIGLAHLSEEFLSENPKAGSTPTIQTAVAPWGTPSAIPTPTLTAYEFDTEHVVSATKTKDLIQTTSFSLSVQPTFAGTTTMVAPKPFATGMTPSTNGTNSTSSGAGAGAGAGGLAGLLSSLGGGAGASSNSSSSSSSDIASILGGLTGSGANSTDSSSSSGSGSGSDALSSILGSLGSSSNSSSDSSTSGSPDLSSLLGGLSNSTGATTDSSAASSPSNSSDFASILSSLSNSSNSTSTSDSSGSSSTDGGDLASLLSSLSSSSGASSKRSSNESDSSSTTPSTGSSSGNGFDLGSLLKSLNCTSSSGNQTTDSGASIFSSTVCGALNGQSSNSTSNSTSGAVQPAEAAAQIIQQVLGALEAVFSPSNSSSA